MAEKSKEYSERQSTQYALSKISTMKTFAYVLFAWRETNFQIFGSKYHGVLNLTFCRIEMP